jgi:AraC-like DNA-binding protein
MGESVRAWRPPVPRVREVLHARFTEHAYPMHTHDSWTLLIVDDGAVRYDLDRHPHGALGSLVTLLPPHVPHDGRAATPAGFRKRVIYLEPDALDPALIGPAVDTPGLADPALGRRVRQLHGALALPGEEWQAASRLALIRERLERHLSGRVADPGPAPRPDPGLADRLRELLDARVAAGVTLEEAARLLHAHPTHLVRAFTARHGLPPHRYLTGRRVDLARRLLLAGHPASGVAQAAGFHDQAHLTRHFRRLLGTTPARYARSGPPA